ncbi:Mercuric transport protein, MerT [hydrothermal vent metagenome]|uniref:Mercuric transport protein, MerT n=1 Tax=hydrothermal vent metagenome TaxID=652676 RepID=A0A3B1B867_9ZZZZ
MSETPIQSSQRSMIAAIVAGIGASLCCVGPLVLLMLGIGGSWISTLTALEPIRPLFIGITLVFIYLAFRKLYLLPVSCDIDKACAKPATRRNQRIIFWLLSSFIIALLAFPWYAEYLID